MYGLKENAVVSTQSYNQVNSNPYESNGNPRVEESSAGNLKCRICKNGSAAMINTTCFHLAVCELCVSQLSLDRCPVCQANGAYKKVQV